MEHGGQGLRGLHLRQRSLGPQSRAATVGQAVGGQARGGRLGPPVVGLCLLHGDN